VVVDKKSDCKKRWPSKTEQPADLLGRIDQFTL